MHMLLASQYEPYQQLICPWFVNDSSCALLVCGQDSWFLWHFSRWFATSSFSPIFLYSLPLLFIAMCYMSTYMLLFTLCWPSTRYSRVHARPSCTCHSCSPFTCLGLQFFATIWVNLVVFVRLEPSKVIYFLHADCLVRASFSSMHALSMLTCAYHRPLNVSQTRKRMNTVSTVTVIYLRMYIFMLHAFLHCSWTGHRFR